MAEIKLWASDSVTRLKGVGPSVAKKLANLGIDTAGHERRRDRIERDLAR